ncbi:PAAR domain-containing protein [Morganella psychrotolerans]|uniref:PAAR domain-containing protein n=1 Tax=Morganella psychrotolerans TaxID=368603 RepID=UPI0039AFB698
MKGIIRVGDRTSGGGYVTSGSSVIKFSGKYIARKGDPVDCPKKGHNNAFISQGHPTMKDHGIPVAFHGYLCSCGCVLISSLTNASSDK